MVYLPALLAFLLLGGLLALHRHQQRKLPPHLRATDDGVDLDAGNPRRLYRRGDTIDDFLDRQDR